MAEDWDALAGVLGYRNEKEMFEDLYLAQRISISRLALKLGAGSATVARRIRLCGIDRRPRGGANNLSKSKQRLYYMDQRLVLVRPLVKEAERLKIHPSTLYKYRRGVIGGKLDALRNYLTDQRTEPLFDSEFAALGTPASTDPRVQEILPGEEKSR